MNSLVMMIFFYYYAFVVKHKMLLNAEVCGDDDGDNDVGLLPK